MNMLYEVYWTAAMVDGEGWLGLRSGTPCIVVTNTDMEILEHLKRVWAGSIYENNKATLTRQTCYTWNVISNRAVGLMMTLYDLLTTRRQKKIREILAAWRSTNTRVQLRESEALDAMRRVFAGEVMYKVAENLCIHPFTLKQWMAGRKRPELLAHLKAEGAIPVEVFAQFEQRRFALSGAAADKGDVPEQEILAVMRRVRVGEITICRAATTLGVAFPTMKAWMNGKYRPNLLARILQEEQSHEEVQLSWIS